MDVVIDKALSRKARYKPPMDLAPVVDSTAPPPCPKDLGPIIIVGAGPSGLFAALRLVEAGAGDRVTIIERCRPMPTPIPQQPLGGGDDGWSGAFGGCSGTDTRSSVYRVWNCCWPSACRRKCKLGGVSMEQATRQGRGEEKLCLWVTVASCESALRLRYES